jgi:hypothetical protein
MKQLSLVDIAETDEDKALVLRLLQQRTIDAIKRRQEKQANENASK